ncbi:uncharacterized protein LOC123511051 [Portunus trituberculatus]|uniref:uncharacterized protein LOC123511051 n=1 Tax=Portunus trituberculatus TaxID=210409 RepID=UPI001E1CDBCF|nr:uncharacterized protein LOC123511051 [Portunus trituberculatus]
MRARQVPGRTCEHTRQGTFRAWHVPGRCLAVCRVGRVVASGNNFDIVLDVQTQNYCGKFFCGWEASGPPRLHPRPRCPPVVDENEARSVAQDGSESSSTSDTTPATSFSLHATTDPSSLRSPVAVCVLALGVTCSNGGNSNGKLDAQHSTAQHSGEIGGELTIQRPDSTAVMSLVYLALSSLTTPTTNPSASATVSRSGKDSALHRAL